MTANVEARAIELEAYDNNSGLSIIVHGGNPGKGLRLQVSQFLLGKHDTPPLLLLPLWFDGQRSQQAHSNNSCHRVHNDHGPKDVQVHARSGVQPSQRHDGVEK